MPLQLTNNWQLLHNHKTDSVKTNLRDYVMKECGWSQDTFYRKLRMPEKLSPAEKKAISIVYEVPVEMLFPETETA